MQSIKFAIVVASSFSLIAMNIGCAPAAVNLVKQNGIVVEKKNVNRYRFLQVYVKRQAESFVVTGHVMAHGRYLVGHVDLAVIDPQGVVLFTGSISPNRSPQSHGRGVNLATFSFRCELPLSKVNPPDNSIVRISVHEEKSSSTTSIFDCGKNSAL